MLFGYDNNVSELNLTLPKNKPASFINRLLQQYTLQSAGMCFCEVTICWHYRGLRNKKLKKNHGGWKRILSCSVPAAIGHREKTNTDEDGTDRPM